jgi:hypothetical protein
VELGRSRTELCINSTAWYRDGGKGVGGEEGGLEWETGEGSRVTGGRSRGEEGGVEWKEEGVE